MTLVDAIVVLCAAPRDFDAEGLASRLVRDQLAACVQIGAPVTSVYQWEGTIERSDEQLLWIKTRRHLFSRVESAIKAVHPYEVPEIIALDVLQGHAPYLAWIGESVQAEEAG